MKQRDISIVLALAGLGAAWYWSKQTNGRLAQILSSVSQPPILPSRTIGSGFIPGIYGGTGLSGILPSRTIGDGYMPLITPPFAVDQLTGDISAPFGTDLMQLPNVQPVNLSLINDAMSGGDDNGEY